jgi:CheY-like chemotaxis protein
MLEKPTLVAEKLSSRHKVVLLVDDDVDFGDCIVQFIKEETPYHVVYAPDAFKALRVVSHLKCDLFLLDYQLPGIDGIDLYDLLHSTPGHEDVPAIYISASSRLPQRELEKRNLIYMHKPIELEELLCVLQSLIGMKQ